MKTLKYYVLDVFTEHPYLGNQLSVVICDDELDLEQFHSISREFGYSETSFVRYSEKDHVLNVRSFTPGDFEVVGAGHNLLGAVCLAIIKEWDIFKHQEDGPYVMIKGVRVPLKISRNNGLPLVEMKQQPAKTLGKVPADRIAGAIGLRVDDLDLNYADVMIVATEVGHLMVPVKSVPLLYQSVPDKTILKKLSAEYGFEGCYLFTPVSANSDFAAETRFFNPGIGIDEDPATGTAAGPLAGYLAMLGHIQADLYYKFLQGKSVKHPSTLHVKVSHDGIWVSGSSVVVMEGMLYI